MNKITEKEKSILKLNLIVNTDNGDVHCNVGVNCAIIPTTKHYRLNYLIRDFVEKLNYL